MALRSLNAAAPAFVPGGGGSGGGGGGASSVPIPVVPVHNPMPPQAPWFSYKIGMQASRVARRTPTESEVHPVQNLWKSGQMAVAVRGRGEREFLDLWGGFFKQKTNSFDTTPLPAGTKVFSPLSGAGRHAGTLLFTKNLISFGTTEDVFQELSTCEGILLQVKETLVCPFVHPENVFNAASSLLSQYLTEERKANILALGSTSIEIPSREEDGPGGCAYYHYIFILQPAARGPLDFPLDRIHYAGGTTVKGLLSYILADQLPLAAHVRLIAATDDEAAVARTEQDASDSCLDAKPEERVVTCVIDYNAYDIAGTFESLEACMALVRTSVQKCQVWSVSHALKIVIINSTPSRVENSGPQDIVNIFDVVQELSTMLSAYCGGIVSFSGAESLDAPNGSINNFMPNALLSSLRPEVVVTACNASAFEGRPFLALTPRSALRMAVSSIPTPYGAGAFTYPIGSTGLYQRVRRVFSAVWPLYQANVAGVEVLAVDKCPNAINHLTGTDYRVRRSGVGALILIALVEGGTYILDLQTSCLAALRSACWGSQLVQDLPVVCVARVCPAVRGSRQYRIVIEDVLPLGGQYQPFAKRWSVLDFLPHEAMEPMCNHDAGALIVRAAYVPLAECNKLIDSTGVIASTYENRQYADNQESKGFSSKRLLLADHAAMGLTLVPTDARPGAEPTYTWYPQEASVARFAITNILPAQQCEALDDVQPGHFAVFLGAREDAAPASLASSTKVTPSTPELLPKAMCSQTLPAPGNKLVVSEPKTQIALDQQWIAGQLGLAGAATCQRLTITPFQGEYVVVAKAQAKLMRVGMVVECLMRVNSTRGRSWELVSVLPAHTQDGDVIVNPLLGVPTSHSEVLWKVQLPLLRTSEMQWMLQAQRYRCGRCNRVDDSGKVDPKDGQYRCKRCWSEGGYGDCVQCDKKCTSGGSDVKSGYFYCEGCWQFFATPLVLAHNGSVPPPPNSSLETQVLTRVACNLIDTIAAKHPLHDVLDLGIGTSTFLRKWISSEVPRFVGVATNNTVFAECEEAITTARSSGRTTEVEMLQPIEGDGMRTVPHLCSDELWSEVSTVHPSQFSAITCFNKMHNCFDSIESARQFFLYVTRALVPGGIFFGTFYCMNPFYNRGASYRNDYFAVSWEMPGVDRPSRLPSSPKGPDDSSSSDLPAPSPGAWKPRMKRNASEVSSDASPPGLADTVLPRIGMRYSLTFFDREANYVGPPPRGLTTPTTPSQMSPFSGSNRGMTPSPSFANSDDQSMPSGSFREAARRDFVIPLDALMVVADECGLELMHDYWGKASDNLAQDNKWTRTLTGDERDFMTTMKMFAFRKKYQRGGASVVVPAAALI